jgi:hypothetical protein
MYSTRMFLSSLGFRVEGSGFNLEISLSSLDFRVEGFRVEGSGFNLEIARSLTCFSDRDLPQYWSPLAVCKEHTQPVTDVLWHDAHILSNPNQVKTVSTNHL